MITFSLLLSFIFGAVIGSFLNVVSLRLNTGKGIGGRSACMSCDNQLTWKELVPILSFVVQKGACKKCKSGISWQYPLIEGAAGIIFVLILWVFPPISLQAAVVTVVHLFAACLLLVIAAYDARHKIIPDALVYTFSFLGLVSLFISSGTSWFQGPTLWALLAGPIIAFPFALLWVVSKGTWMGLGDAKLALGIGWFLGISGGVNAVTLAFWIAATISVVWLLMTRGSLKPRTEIPFGPYLILGMYIVLLFGVQVIDLEALKFIFSSGV